VAFEVIYQPNGNTFENITSPTVTTNSKSPMGKGTYYPPKKPKWNTAPHFN